MNLDAKFQRFTFSSALAVSCSFLPHIVVVVCNDVTSKGSLCKFVTLNKSVACFKDYAKIYNIVYVQDTSHTHHKYPLT